MEQLLYGSGDDIAGRTQGGWGVLRVTPGVSAERVAELQKLASVQMPTTMPQFPTADQLATRPRRFRAEPSGDGFAVCMSAEAGVDHTKRPGNVVSHCAWVERSASLRVTDWFDAEGWVLPWGPRQVRDATLPEQLTPPAGWPTVAGFLRSNPEQLQLARWVVSAGVAKLLTRQPLIVKTRDVRAGVHWVSAMLWRLDSDWGREWSIYLGEDRDSLTRLAPKGLFIAVVAPDTAVPERMLDGVVDATGQPAEHEAWGQIVGDLLMAPDDVAASVFEHRDALVDRLWKEAQGDSFTSLQALKVAWLSRPGALLLGQDDAIRELVGGVGERVRAWPELRNLAANVGEDVADDAPTQSDIYGNVESSSLGSPYDEPGGAKQPEEQDAPERVMAPAPEPQGADAPEPQLIDEALRAVSHFGSLDCVEGEWLTRAGQASPEDRRRMWAVAAVASWVAPRPEHIVDAVRTQPDLAPELVRRVARRSQERYGPDEALEQWLGEAPWQ